MGILLLIAAIQAFQAGPDRLPFTDTCTTDPSFVEFRTQLSAAVARQDVAALRPLVAQNVHSGFGKHDSGWPVFVRTWRLDRAAESELWVELAELLSLGCEEYEGDRIAPGNFMKMSAYDELFIYVAVTKGAALRSQPDDRAPMIMALDNHVLFHNGDGPEHWLWVRLTDGRHGYVRSSEARSGFDYRARFEKQEGRWVMSALIAGD